MTYVNGDVFVLWIIKFSRGNLFLSILVILISLFHTQYWSTETGSKRPGLWDVSSADFSNRLCKHVKIVISLFLWHSFPEINLNGSMYLVLFKQIFISIFNSMFKHSLLNRNKTILHIVVFGDSDVSFIIFSKL